MQKRIVINNGKKYIVNCPSSEDVGPACEPGTLWMQSTDLLWYAVNLTGTSASNDLGIYVNQTPLAWESVGGQDFGFQLLTYSSSVYQVYLSGSAGDVTCSIAQTPWFGGNSDGKPYLLLSSLTDGYFYVVSAQSGSMYLYPNPKSRVWLYNTSPPPDLLLKGSLVFNSSSAFLTASANTDFVIGTGNFTVEWFQYQIAAPGVGISQFPRIFSLGSYTTTDDMLAATQELDGPVQNMYMAMNAGWIFNPIATPLTGSGKTPYLNKWCHFAYCRTGSLIQLFKDGIAIATTSSAAVSISSSKPLFIGAEQYDPTITEFPGFITNFHFVNGACLYSGSTYTVPTSPITPIAQTKLLLLASTSASAFVDSSGTNKKFQQNVVGWSSLSPF